MTGNKVFVAIAMTAAQGVLSSPAPAAMEEDGKFQAGSVNPCSLDGVNPAYHPEIFGNAAAARSYGFIQGPDRVWHVEGNCAARGSSSSVPTAPAKSGARKRR
jgi:hypothetical protein